MRLVVVGGDAAGMSAASVVRRARDDAEVVVLERGPHTSYSMCGIPMYVGGEVDDAADLVVRTPEEHREAGIDVRTGVEAVAVDPGGRTVEWRDLSSGQRGHERYDALLLATGAHPRVPDVPGLAEHALVVHTLDEGQALRRRLDASGDVRQVAVLGAGYIGMELAEALVRRGIDARLIERAPQVMGTLDPEMAAVVADRLERFGVEVCLEETIEAVRDNGRGAVRDDGPSVAFDDGSGAVREGGRGAAFEVCTDRGAYPADLVVVAVGATPNTALGEDAGCRVGPSGALVVDGRMRTTVPGIWAAGDCVETVNLVSGAPVNIQLGTHANKQGKIAGIDLAALPGQGEAVFPGVVGTAVTRVCDWEIGRTGLTAAEAEEAGIDAVSTTFVGSAKAGYLPDAGEVHVLLRAERGTGRVVGAQLVGTGNVAKRIDVAAVWCQLGVTVGQAQLLDLSYAPPFGGVWDLLQVGARKLARELGVTPRL